MISLYKGGKYGKYNSKLPPAPLSETEVNLANAIFQYTSDEHAKLRRGFIWSVLRSRPIRQNSFQQELIRIGENLGFMGTVIPIGTVIAPYGKIAAVHLTGGEKYYFSAVNQVVRR